MYKYFFVCMYLSIASDLEETMHAFLCIRSRGGIFLQFVILNPETRLELNKFVGWALKGCLNEE